MARISLHIGAPKTGTTYLQDLLFANRRVLAEAGTSYPGAYAEAHFEAVLDLRSMSFKGHADPAVAGRWDRLVEKAVRWPGNVVVISHELLCGCDDDTVAAAIGSFGGHDVHVVLTARDLGRQVPAMWQEQVKNGGTVPFDRYVTRLTREPRRGRDANVFWRQQDVAETARRWCEHVPVEQFHVVTVPPDGAPLTLLWQRFAAAVGIDPAHVDTQLVPAAQRSVNPSLGYGAAELLRRVNAALGEALPWPAYEATVKRGFAEELLQVPDPSGGPQMPDPARAWLDERTQAMTAAVRELGVDVVGDLADLQPRARAAAVPLTDDDVLSVAAGALADLLTKRSTRHRAPRENAWAARVRRSGMVHRLPAGIQARLRRRDQR